MLGILDAFDDVFVQPLLPDSAVLTLDIGVLLRLYGLDMLNGYSQFLGPDQKLATDVFWAVINPSGWLTGPVAVWCRPECSFKPLVVRRPRGFFLPMLNAVAEGYRIR